MANSNYPVLDGAGNTIIPAGRPFVINKSNLYMAAMSAVPVATPAATGENVLATIKIPGGMIGLNGRVILDMLWSMTNNANVKTGRVRLGGLAGSILSASTLTSFLAARTFSLFYNRNALNSQIGFGGGSGVGTTGGANFTSAIDTSVDQDLVITGAKALAGDSMVLEAYSVGIERIG